MINPTRLGGGMLIVYVLAAVLPAVFYMWRIYEMDKVEKEPWSLLFRLILGGVGAAFPAVLLEQLALNVIVPSLQLQSDVVYAIVCALFIGLIEEGCKFFFLYRFSWNNPEFDCRFDGVVYAVFVSLGFAAFENIIYVTQYGLSVALMRALLAIPGHMSFAVIAGLYYGRAKIEEVRGNPRGVLNAILKGYGFAVVLHAFYDACAMIGSDVSVAVFVVFVILMFLWVRFRLKRAAAADVSVYY